MIHYNDPNADPLEKFCVKITIDENNTEGCWFTKTALSTKTPTPEPAFSKEALSE